MKSFALFGAAAILACSLGGASAMTSSMTMHRHHGHSYAHRVMSHQMAARTGAYRCHGISYGTGASSCGTATGGPVGGINSRN